MRKIILSLVAILIGVNSYAQIFTIGPRLGISQSTLKVEETIDQFKYNSGDPIVGFHAGVFARVKLSAFYIQPEVLFTSAGGNIKVTQNSAGATAEEIKKFTYNRVDVPIMVGYKISVLRFNLGPVASFNVNTKEKSPKQIGQELKDKYKSATLGLQAGVGLDISKVVIDLKYETGFSSMTEGITVNGNKYEFDQRGRQIILSVGLKLL